MGDLLIKGNVFPSFIPCLFLAILNAFKAVAIFHLEVIPGQDALKAGGAFFF